MKVVVPTPITLLETNVPPNTEPEWTAGVSYDQDTLVKLTAVWDEETHTWDEETHTWDEDDLPTNKVYKSLRSDNIDRYPPDWITPVVETATSTTSQTVETGIKTFTTQSGKGFSPGMVVKITKTTTPRSVNMTAEIISYSDTSLQVSVYSSSGEGTHTNWTITTEDEIGFWKEVSSTEQYKMFDEYINTQTLLTGELTVKVGFEYLDYLALFGLVGADVRVEIWDSLETTMAYEKEVSLIYGAVTASRIFDWYEYFFGVAQPLETIYLDVGNSYRDAVAVISITAGEGVEVGCGNVVCGRVHDIGKAQHGMSIGIQDFSTKETDEEGRTKLVPGYWAKKGTFTLYLESWQEPGVYKLLSSLSGVPAAWILDEGGVAYDYATLYGTYRDFSVIASSTKHAWCNLEIEGLI